MFSLLHCYIAGAGAAAAAAAALATSAPAAPAPALAVRLERPSRTTLRHEETHCDGTNIIYVLFPNSLRFCCNGSHGHHNHAESSCTSVPSSGAVSPPIHKAQNILVVIYAILRSFLLSTGTSSTNGYNTVRQPISMCQPGKLPGIFNTSLPQLVTVLLFYSVKNLPKLRVRHV